MSLWSDIKSLWSKDSNTQEEDIGEVPNPQFSQPLVRYSGQPGTGKSNDMYRIGMLSGFHYRMPVFVQDTKGDLSKYHKSLIRSLERRDDVVSKKKLDFLRNKVRFVVQDYEGKVMLDTIKLIQDRVARDEAYTHSLFIVDEAGTLRVNGGESFWFVASTLRNAKILCKATSHRESGEGGVPPIAREATRAVVVYSQYDRVEFFGKEIERVSVPFSAERVYIDSVGRTEKTFSIGNNDTPIKVENIPECLIHPVNSTRVEKFLF